MGPLFQLGNAANGVDGNRALKLMELARLVADCGNCVARRLCPVCPAALSELSSGVANARAFQKLCATTIDTLLTRLEQYTTTMERNATIVDAILPEQEETVDWLRNINIVATKEQLHNSRLAMVEFEECL
jgi:hypothetical protein